MTTDASSNLTLPDQDGFADAIGQQYVTDTMYADMEALVDVINEYDQPIAFEYLLHRAHEERGYSVNPSDERAFKKHKDRLDKLATYNSGVYFHVVGRIPRSDIWVDLALDSLSESAVTAANLNEVQERCVTLGEERSQTYFEATKRELEERALRSVDLADYGSTGNLVDDVIDNVATIAADILPQRQESMRQGGQSSAGNANEEIAARSLISQGLEHGERESGCDFTTKTEDDADLIVYDVDDTERYVEVKSTAARERVGRATNESDDYWVLVGFFDDVSEVRNGVLFENDQTPAWKATTDVAYVPPEIVSQVRDRDANSDDSVSASDLTNKDGDLYLRANNLFPEDMASINQNGELTDASPGHEEQFLH